MAKTGIKDIVIVRAEGPCELCGQKPPVKTFKEADAILKDSAQTAPETGGYDKHDFIVTFEDGEKYEGRIDVMHPAKGRTEPLKEHIIEFCRFYGGLCTDAELPSHITPKEYQVFLNRYTAEDRESYADFLNKYAIQESD